MTTDPERNRPAESEVSETPAVTPSTDTMAAAEKTTSSEGSSQTIPASPISPPAKEAAEDEKWTFDRQLILDQRAREERGLDATHGITLLWDHISLRGVGGSEDIRYAWNFGSMMFPLLAWRARKRSKVFNRAQADLDGDVAMQWRKGDPVPKRGENGLRKGQRYLFHDFHGCVMPGEMMLVVGRPGSGCTAFLKTLAGQTASYAGLEGSVYYGSMRANSAEHRPLAADVRYVSEEEWHDPNLLVGQTMDFALRQNTLSKAARRLGEDGHPISAGEYQHETKMHLLDALRMAQTHDTKVGDQYVRGVSGGERKRLTLIEAMAGPAHVMLWDNPTRGLDANTANLFTSVCRESSDIQKQVNVMTLYQAGNSIYQQFDKVCVIAEGRVIYYGPRAEARAYFEAMGFVHMEGANTADYLTAVTALNERQIAPGFEGRVPTTAAEFAAAYRDSAMAARMRAETDAALADHAAREAESQIVQSTINAEKARFAVKSLPQRRSFPAQIKATVIKDAQQRWGDQWSFWALQATTFIQAWIVGSVYYNIPDTTAGLYLRCGALFVTIFYPVIFGLAELHAAFNGRGVLAKHKSYNMYRASTVLIAKMIVDAPIYAVQNFIYVAIVYWMSGMRRNAGFFFICFLFTWMVTMIFATLFRSVGYMFNEFNDASKVAGTVFIFFVVYGGFVIYTPSMKPWFGWIRWINPLYYTFEAVIANELTNLILQCVPPHLAPYGPPYVGKPAGCAVIGGTPGSTLVSGTAFLEYALRMSRSHVWRNFGIIIALWILIAAIGMVFLELLPSSGSTQDVTLYKRGGGPGEEQPQDEEATGEKGREGYHAVDAHGKVAAAQNLAIEMSRQSTRNRKTTFTWNDVCYTVKTGAGKDLQLLDHVSGYCRAGTITALMGSSGAGKTTLMDVLAARKSEGVITGEVKLNGHSLPVSFQRTTGYCEQLDVHLPQATVREALEFSALLRQPRNLSDKEKLAYVDTIVDLLELGDIVDAIIGEPGAGLGVEQRKRLTIGVELVSRPSLLFLDEPTSGLDGQSSYVIVGFLRKLASVGQAILCTIHQPSAALFAGFDNLLLLTRGGKTVYFGAITDLERYFVSKGVDWPADQNPAEYMIDVVSGDASQGRNWAKVWLDSAERSQMLLDIDAVNAAAAPDAAVEEEDAYEYAATLWTQLRVVTWRATVQVYRNVEYTRNKMILHVATGLISGFSWFQIGDSLADLQNRMFSVFMFVFIAPGVMVQTQPKFIKNRDVFEAREKKAKFYAWHVFCFSEIAAEVPYLLLCAFIYWVCWYPASGLDMSAGVVGPVYLQMTFYEFLYTGMGQFIAAYAPNPTFAASVLPLFFGILIAFTGILIPYPQLTAFWRYWMYYLDPFNYLMQGLLTFPLWDAKVECKPHEFGLFDPPPGLTCGEYLGPFTTYATGYVNNPSATKGCEYCGYARGSEFLGQMNITRHIDGWKGILITLLFCFTSYGLVFLLLKLRSKKTKTAKS